MPTSLCGTFGWGNLTIIGRTVVGRTTNDMSPINLQNNNTRDILQEVNCIDKSKHKHVTWNFTSILSEVFKNTLIMSEF